MAEARRMVLKRPSKESATIAPKMGKIADTPTHVLTFLMAVEVDWWRSFVKYVMRLPAKP